MTDDDVPAPAGAEGPLVPARLFEQLYDELRTVARRYMGSERANHSLRPTELVDEAFIRLMQSNPIAIEDRVHFLRLAARTMRRVLVDHAKRKGATRHGGAMRRVTLTDDALAVSPEFDLIDLDRALERLSKLSERQTDILEMRFIAGLTVEEVAAELGVSPRTIKGDTRVALAWLRRELD
ncbi:MAG: ECF-type sigma factor [Candidatus Krumholzibacteria bacterium]|nr:ECF-type sigma factor [Candidatus Krumholzibacteria bacterium]